MVEFLLLFDTYFCYYVFICTTLSYLIDWLNICDSSASFMQIFDTNGLDVSQTKRNETKQKKQLKWMWKKNSMHTLTPSSLPHHRQPLCLCICLCVYVYLRIHLIILSILWLFLLRCVRKKWIISLQTKLINQLFHLCDCKISYVYVRTYIFIYINAHTSLTDN